MRIYILRCNTLAVKPKGDRMHGQCEEEFTGREEMPQAMRGNKPLVKEGEMVWCKTYPI